MASSVLPKKNPTAQGNDLSKDSASAALPHKQRETPSNEGAWLSIGYQKVVPKVRFETQHPPLSFRIW